MNISECISTIKQSLEQYTTVPTKKMSRLINPIIDEYERLEKENKQLNKEIREINKQLSDLPNDYTRYVISENKTGHLLIGLRKNPIGESGVYESENSKSKPIVFKTQEKAMGIMQRISEGNAYIRRAKKSEIQRERG